MVSSWYPGSDSGCLVPLTGSMPFIISTSSAVLKPLRYGLFETHRLFHHLELQEKDATFIVWRWECRDIGNEEIQTEEIWCC